MRLSTTRFLGFSLSVMLSLGPLAQAGVAPVGTLSGDNKVKVNGRPLASSQLAFPGDTIEAPGAAMGSIEISPNSVARFTAAARASVERSGQEVWLGLQSGYVSVHEGDKPVSVRAHGGKITASSGAVFDVAQVKGTTTVTAVKGSVIVSEGGLAQPRLVKQGENVQMAFLEPGPLAYDPKGSTLEDKDKARRSTCDDRCKKDSSTKECKDFKALKKECSTLRKACAADSSKCAAYGNTCKSLDGCAGYAGVAQAQAAGASSAASASASAAAAAGAAGAATSATAVAVTAAAVAGTAAAVAVPVAAASQGSGNQAVVSSIK